MPASPPTPATPPEDAVLRSFTAFLACRPVFELAPHERSLLEKAAAREEVARQRRMEGEVFWTTTLDLVSVAMMNLERRLR